MKATKYLILNLITLEIKKIKDSRHCKALLTIRYNMFQGTSLSTSQHMHYSLKSLCVAWVTGHRVLIISSVFLDQLLTQAFSSSEK